MGSVLLYLLKSPTILSVIHDLTDRWLFFGINLDQVLVPILCQPQCFSQGEHANLVPGLVDNTHLPRSDPAVYSGRNH